MRKLSASITPAQFDNGYWYATELKEFANRIGIASAGKLRKDELEKAIKLFLANGKVQSATKRNLSTAGVKDVERGLSLRLPVIVYTSNRETKDFLEKEASKLIAGLKRKSGARYRLNRWREGQLAAGIRITYGDLVKEYVRLSQTEGPFPQAPTGRYINFLADFLKQEKGAKWEDARKAWHELKKLDAPKNYRSWVKIRQKK